jgi:hypothetical protein
VRFSLTAGKKSDLVLEICHLDGENRLLVNALSTILVGRTAAEFCALGSGLAAEFGMGPAGCLFGIENSYDN